MGWGRLTRGGEFPNRGPLAFSALAGGQRKFDVSSEGTNTENSKAFGLSDPSEHSKLSETEARHEIRLRRCRSA